MTTVPPPSAMPKSPPPRNAKSPTPTATAATFAIPTSPKLLPFRIVFNAVEGWGKTTLAAYAPNALMLMARGEDGYSTLLGAKRVPAIPAASVETWDELLATLDSLIADPQGAKLLALDALGGFERMCHEHCCRVDFKDEWGETGFMSFHKGYAQSVTYWLGLLQRLDRLRELHGISILALSHSTVQKFKNPDGSDFDRYECDLHARTLAPTKRWADAILFGDFLTVLDKGRTGKGPAKGIGGTQRVVYTEHSDARDCKNRYGMPSVFPVPNDPKQSWPTLHAAIMGDTK